MPLYDLHKPQQDDWLFLHSCSWCLSPGRFLLIKPSFFMEDFCSRLVWDTDSCFTLQYLTCLKTSRSLTDKLSFDVGLQEDSVGTVWLTLYRVRSAFCCFLIEASPPEWPLLVGLTLTRNQWPMEETLLTVFCATFDIWTTESLGAVYQVGTILQLLLQSLSVYGYFYAFCHSG